MGGKVSGGRARRGTAPGARGKVVARGARGVREREWPGDWGARTILVVGVLGLVVWEVCARSGFGMMTELGGCWLGEGAGPTCRSVHRDDSTAPHCM